ncbi:MAG TPA: acyl-[acyl-carrier-protein]--UDP-N-acetylglucosamine O-acyltransferase [Deltaproteobacteria bacterium]|nr:acyl-[acyl-carrier-protein]--UDP-N-acetylglucosamine O-acyltransferase [Deltaproteobacteria bacterium]
MIHPTAIIESSAYIDDTAEVGPYCIIGKNAKIKKGTRLFAHVNVGDNTEIGESCTVHPFASLGGPPQDISYRNEETLCTIGDNNVIREYVTISRGTRSSGATIVGNSNFIMASSHIAHDCRVGNNIIMANGATLAGHVHVADRAILSGLCAVHQFCSIGTFAFVSGLTGVPKDIPPFVMAAGNRARLYGLNIVGLERNGFSKEEIAKLKKAYRILFRSALSLQVSLKMVEEELDGDNVAELLRFIRSSERGICR